jgi:hypothetical protein
MARPRRERHVHVMHVSKDNVDKSKRCRDTESKGRASNDNASKGNA